jgi:CheY-like chemotaxis protein
MFSRRQVVEPKVVDLNDSISRVGSLLKRLLGEDVELVLELSAKHARIYADTGGIEQVVMNLAVNARDAMPRGGQLVIRTSDAIVEESGAASHVGVQPGAYVLLTVCDTGIGMDEATQLRMFEPFFTTKSVGKGTGLGLSTVFGIVEQCKGNISVESRVGDGATFSIHFPCVDAALETVHPTPLGLTRRGHETVLLVEDDDALRQVAKGILSRAGYIVFDARGAEEALELAAHRSQAIHLLVSDVVMPQMSGPELAEKISASRPQMKVLLMSGHTDDDVVRHGVMHGTVAFLQKPLTPDSLTRKVREVLDSSR